MALKISTLKATTALALVAGGLSGVAAAQDTAEDAEARQDTVIVTATRRAESIQDIPLNIAAVGAAEIEEQGFDELADVLSFVPGINIVDRGGRQGNPIIVRGLNADPLGSGDGNNDGGGTVATYLGEIPVFVDLKLNDLERVEVLLGPQGTLYGAGTLGGAIRYIPKRPDFEGDSFSIRGEAYQYSEAEDLSTDMGFTFNKSLGDNFALRASLDIRNDSGFIDYPFIVKNIGVSEPDPDFSDPAARAANFAPREDLNGEETFSGRIAARWQPLEWLDGTATYYFQNADIEGRTLSSARSTVPAGEYEAGLRVQEPNKITNELFALEVTADLGFAELTSATGFSKFEDEGQRDQTDLLITLEYSYEAFPTFTAFTFEEGIQERFNQEVRLVSTTDGPLSWIVGGFYNKLQSWGSSSEFTPGYAQFAGFDRPDNLEYFSQANSEVEESAIFGEVGYDITDKLSVTVGGRYYEYDVQAFGTQDFPLFDPGFVALSLDEIKDQPFDPDLAQSRSGNLFKFNTSYDVTDDVLVYFTYSEGYRIGGVNGVAPCPDLDPNDTTIQQGACALAVGQEFLEADGSRGVSTRNEREYGPDTTTNYELGLKSTLLDGDLNFNVAAYLVEWEGAQLGSATVNANIPITINADGAESTGVEMSANWRATDQLRLRGSVSYTKAELTAPVPSLVRTISPPGFGNAFEDGESGDRLPGSPETQFSLFGTYTQPLNDAELLFNLGYTWQGDVLSRAGGRGNGLTLDSYGIANGSIVYDKGDWKATLFVNNILDEYAETGVRSNELFNQTINGANVRSYGTFVAPPRAVGLRFSWDFE